MTQTILLEKNNNLASITFNRPAAMNSFNDVMAEEFEAITNQVRSDKSIRAVMLKGAGPLFMAGGDIRFFAENLQTINTTVEKIGRNLNAAVLNLMMMPKPVLACVHGSVAGVGLSLMLACDLVIAADHTKFTTAYAGLGVSADGGVTINLPRHVGVKKAMELLLIPDIFDVATAQQLKLLNWVVPADQLATQAEKILQRLANGPTQAYAEVKKLLNDSWENPLARRLELEVKSFEKCALTDDFKEGVTAFLQKRKAEFHG